ncbi:MAG: DNA polymerase III subunit alpha [Rhodospirillaceae bacterium]|nr:DNA polymerase III subunit alpha [Rhodospirillaceae bacterium]
MPVADFIHLRVHSAYSLSEGALKIPEIVRLAKGAAMPAVAITDTNNLFGALEFSSACKEGGVQPIVGCQLTLAGERGDRDRTGTNRDFHTVVVLAQDAAGYGNLMKLSSRAYLEPGPAEPPHVTWSDLEAHAQGLILLTGGAAGPLGAALLNGQQTAAEAMLGRLKAAFGDRLYLEIARHGAEDERRAEAALIDLAYAADVPLVATNEAFFADATMHDAHDALLCIASSSVVADRNRRRLNAEYRFKSPAEMKALFADLPEAIENTVAIARRCAVMADARKPILPPFVTADGGAEPEELRRQAEAGLERRLERQVYGAGMGEAERAAAAKPYRERLDFELGVIVQMGFPGYFLIVSDFINWAKVHGIPVGPGRGSGAGSVAAWALGITDLDPLRWGLLFERFLNPERVSMPDFDVDFCQDRRDEVIAYVRGRYGRDRVAQIITFGKLQARAVVRDVGRVLQMPRGQVDRIAKLVPYNPANPVTLQQAIDGEPQLQEMRRSDEGVAQLVDIALKLEGLYRHASTHAAGVVIGDRPLEELIPLYKDPRHDALVTQFNMKDVEKAGLVKFDFLGLTTLSLLVLAIDHLKQRGIELDLLTLPLDDKKTFDLLGSGDTTGVFQLESGGMRNALRSLKPDRFEDIIAVVALYRPGPMENIPSYINRKHGREKPDYLHPMLEPTLKETYGIIIYQEQVMEIAKTLAGYTLGGADLLRRAMGKKIRAEMEAQRELFVKGAVAKGVEKDRASHIFDLVEKFAGYGFNKSHAAAYALVAYQTAYLKANYPVEFFAASMTYNMHSPDKLANFRRELNRRGLSLLPPDVNASQPRFSVDAGAVRYALAAIKNVGEGAMAAMVKEREARGRFRDLADFASRLDPATINKRQLENLIKAGALDGLHPNRRQLFDGAEVILRHGAAAQSERKSGQNSLFGGDDLAGSGGLPLPNVPDWSESDRLRQEYEAIGFYLSAHPLDGQEKMLAKLGVLRFGDIAAKAAHGILPANVKLAGIAISYRQRSSAKGAKYAVVQMSDPSGVFEIMVFNEAWTASRDLVDRAVAESVPLLVEADAQRREDEIGFFARQIMPFDQAAARTNTELEVFVDAAEAVDTLGKMLAREKSGRGVVRLKVPDGAAEIEVELKGRYAITSEVRQAIKSIPGVVHVEMM